MGNVIIDNRIAQLTEHKRQLLKMKKVDRGDGLKRTNDTISRLKRWNKDLGHKNVNMNAETRQEAQPKHFQGHDGMVMKFIDIEPLENAEGQKEEQIAPLGVQMYDGTLGSFDRQCAKGA